MKVKILFMILIAGLIPFSIVLILTYKVKMETEVGHGFERYFPKDGMLRPARVADLGYDSYYIAGKGRCNLYLANQVAPRTILLINSQSLDTSYFIFDLPLDGVQYRNIRVKVDSPYFYMADGTVPVIYMGKFPGNSVERLLNVKEFFLDYIPFDGDQFAIRSLDLTQRAVLGRISASDGRYSFHPSLLNQQIDGVFCTEGVFVRNYSKNGLLYCYLYRNEFLLLDNDLTLLSRGQTIDTNRVAKIVVAVRRQGKSKAFSKPPLVINRQCAIEDGKLYVNSSVPADNENRNDLRAYSCVDVYDIDTTEYCFSMKVPAYAGKRFRHFEVIGDLLLAHYQQHVVTYDLGELR